MTSDAYFSNSDLDDLLNQAADAETDEPGSSASSSSHSGRVSTSSRRGLFSGRTANSTATPQARSSETAAAPQVATDSQKRVAKAETSSEDTVTVASVERNTSTVKAAQRRSKTPPKPVESPPELKPVMGGAMEGTSDPQSSKFIRLACACGYRMRIKAQNAGKTIQCPKCEASLKVPASAAAQGGTVHFRLEDNFSSKLSKVISLFDEEAKTLNSKKTLSFMAYRSLKSTIGSIARGHFDADRVRDSLQDLGQSEDGRAYEMLREAWESEPGNLQSDILNALGHSKDPRSTGFLLQLLMHELPEVRIGAIQSLGLTEDPRVVPVMLHYGQHHPDQKYAVSDGLLKIGEPAVIPMLELLSSTDNRELLTDIVLVLGRLKSSKAIKPLLELLEDSDSSLQGYIAEALGLIGDPRSMTSLLPLLESEDEKLRVQVATALGRVPYPGCLASLIKALQDESLDVRKRCAAALGELGDERAAPALVPLLSEDNTELRIAAAESLGRIGDRRAVPYLLKIVNDQDESVILKALGSLRKIKDPSSVPALMQLLEHHNSRIRQRAIDVLGQVGDAVVAERLEQILKHDRAEDVRAAAAKALGEIRDAGSVDALIDALHDAFIIRCRAIVSLGEIGDESALPSLLAMLRDPAPEIRYHASQALVDLAPSTAVKHIQPLLEDSNAMVRRGAAKALETLGQGDAQQMLGSSTRQGVRKFWSGIRNLLVGISPGGLADTIRHGSGAAKGALLGTIVVPILLVAGYFWFMNSGMTSEKVALLRRGNVSSLDLASDGATVAVGRTTGVVEIWDLPAQKRTKIFAPDGLNGEIIGVSIVPGAKQLVVCTSATAGGVDIASGQLLWQVSGHQGAMRRFIASHDRKFVMVGSTDGVFSFWDVKNGQPIGAGAVVLPRDKTQTTELSNNGEMIAGVGSTGPVTVWSTGTAAEVTVINTLADSTLVDMEFSSDDQLLALSDTLGRLAIIDLNTMKVVQQVREPIQDKRGFPQLFDKLKFHSEAGTLQGFMGGTQLFSMNLSTGELTQTKAGAPLIGNAFGTQPDGTLFALGQEDASAILVFDRKDGQRKAILDMN